ncbi:MAG: 1-deoxy-D-xylulose-5-phosphate synthase [Candidatus Omnitrophota bacterium]
MYKLLDKINSPADLKKLKIEELPLLAQEIREEIIATVSRTGGHLAASLGAVELAIALHYVFDAPKDVIVWDVGHQAYAHKILTGRRDNFRTLRQLGGISGFPNRFESAYDAFTCGHGSTSVSLALGVAAARDLAGKNFKVAAVIGDGAMQGGMAFEALNHTGHMEKDILVIVNDNEFSIDKTVGGFSKYLNRIITNPVYNKIHKDLRIFIKKLPFWVYSAARKFEEGLKSLIVPGMVFEELGLRYFGPVNGHDLKTLVITLRSIANIKEPRLLHVVTKKGKGYVPAERKPDKFHGTAPFEIETGEVPPAGEKTYTQVFSEALVDLAKNDEKIIAITAAMPEGTGLDKFAAEFPKRCFNVGMAEQHAVTFAAGMAKEGYKSVVAVYSTFMQRSYDQILHDVCLQKLNVVFALDRAGVVGEDGPTHHGIFDIAYLRHMPNLVLMAPKDDVELKKMLDFALSHNGPVAIRYPRGRASKPAGAYICPLCNQKVSHNHDKMQLGTAEILKQGKDIAIIACGSMAWPAYEAAVILSRAGIEAHVINTRFIKPLDGAVLLELSKSVKLFFTIEEGVLEGGFGSAVMEFFEKENIPAKIKRIGLPGKFIEHATRSELLEKYGLNAQAMADNIKREFSRCHI